jgi:H2-forming N5,N10-methylenetetrahydromethanopterin dehydrogenase-like enzyme
VTCKVSNHIGAGSNIAGKIVAGVNAVHADIAAGATAALTVDFILYDHNTFYIDTIFEGLRENAYVAGYFGCSVDIQSVSGVLNTNPERCIVHSSTKS